jgi:hypothetical protein
MSFLNQDYSISNKISFDTTQVMNKGENYEKQTKKGLFI